MNLAESIRLAFSGLSVNKLQSILTILGIVIGVAAVVTLAAVGRGVEAVIVSEFEALGNDLLFVIPAETGLREASSGRGSGEGLTTNDAQALADPFRVPDIVAVAPHYSRPAVVTRGRHEIRTTIAGTNQYFPQVRDFHPVLGSFFGERDVISGARVAVLGETAYETLFPERSFPIGESIRINNVNFQVIGVLEGKGSANFTDQDDLIVVPLSTAQKRLFPARRTDGKYRLDIIYVQVVNEERQNTAIVHMEQVLRQQHGIAFRGVDDFSILKQSDVIGAFSQINDILTIFLGVIASVSLLVGGIGIMNIMLVSVAERTWEIGLRKAVGARRYDILMQFLVEAVVLATVGGVIGLAMGALGALIIGQFSPLLDPVLAWDQAILALLFSGGIGIFFGLYPAIRAASLSPIDALRYE